MVDDLGAVAFSLRKTASSSAAARRTAKRDVQGYVRRNKINKSAAQMKHWKILMNRLLGEDAHVRQRYVYRPWVSLCVYYCLRTNAELLYF